MPKLSIIVPVYRVENSLRDCLNSILSQDYTDIEVLLVDDGSDDHSGEICDNIAANDQRVRVFHQANQGLSGARNTGLDHALGEYITFVDSDDVIDAGIFARLMSVMDAHPGYDILEYSVIVAEGANDEHRLNLPDRVYTSADAYWIQGRAYTHTYAWNKVYRASLFDDVRFPVGAVFEDAYTLPQLLKHARIIATTPIGYYHYRSNPAGITQTATGEEMKHLLQAHLIYIKEGHEMSADYYAAVLNIQLKVNELTHEDPVLPKMKFHGTWKLDLLQLIGMKGLCKLNRFIHRIWVRSH